jgi:guanine deaminase
MILEGTLIRPNTSGRVELIAGQLTIDPQAGRIVQVRTIDDAPTAADSSPQPPDLGGHATEWLVAPGFIDAHVHLPQFDAIGAGGLPLLDWLDRAILPVEARWNDPDYARDRVRAAIGRMLDHGTTAFAAYATIHHDATRAALEEAHALGLRAAIGQPMMDQHHARDSIRSTDALLEEACALLEENASRHGGRVEVALTPRYAVGCSARLMTGLAELARDHGALIQTHLSETRDEVELALKIHPASNYTAIYDQYGLLTPRTVLGHGVWLDDNERQLLAQRGAVVAHCPVANAFLRSGAMDWNLLDQCGVRLAIGSDIGAGSQPAMPRVGQALLRTVGDLHPEGPIPDPAEVWWRLTRGNALALGWENVGHLEPGAEADLLVLRPDVAWSNAPDPLGMLLHSWDDRWLKAVIVAGRVARRFP